MNDFIVDGQPLETPDASAEQSYADMPPTAGRAFGAMFGESSTLGSLMRSDVRQRERRAEGIDTGDLRIPDTGQRPEPTLPPEQINKLYAPQGTTITDRPMTMGLAKIIGKQKQEEMDRENVLARYAQSTSALKQFGMGTAAFLADPLNLASTFIPGVGEETASAGLARIGIGTTGALGRAAVRGVTGAVGATAGQLPLAALRYGLGTEQASDYDLRSAMKDLAFAAAGGAVLHAGFGAVGDAIRARRTTPGNVAESPGSPPGGDGGGPPGGAWSAGPTTPQEKFDQAAAQIDREATDTKAEIDRRAAAARDILNANAGTRDDAMRSSVAQVVSGRPVEVSGGTGEVVAAPDTVRLYRGTGKNLGEGGETAFFTTDPAKAALYGDVSFVDVAKNELGKFAQGHGGPDEFVTDDAGIIGRSRPMPQPDIQAIAERQQQLYRDGSAPGLTQDELLSAENDLLGEKEAPEEGAPKAEAPKPAAADGTQQADPELGALEKAHADRVAGGAILTDEERAELDHTAATLARSQDVESAALQAAQCLMEESGGL